MKVRIGFYSEQNRNEIYRQLIEEAKYLEGSCKKVLEAFAGGRMTAHKISEKINYPVHLVHARLNDLMKDGYVIDTKNKIKNEDTGKMNTEYEIDANKIFEQKQLIFI